MEWPCLRETRAGIPKMLGLAGLQIRELELELL